MFKWLVSLSKISVASPEALTFETIILTNVYCLLYVTDSVFSEAHQKYLSFRNAFTFIQTSKYALSNSKYTISHHVNSQNIPLLLATSSEVCADPQNKIYCYETQTQRISNIAVANKKHTFPL